ncbi:NmrA family NAD(P)-binding protein [Paraburkholderia sp.]|uniref:NmrA family NAD(P)-binding protein n=1 Tax=Paraburkholderia sp. TaxID=1926495 RepID=UPI00239FACE3|nr:NmrA family NAD(P)-binding protein [Paraburkholderia sp.]MDE1181618.1 NmrA family NAD(P)-binding protein [Paraburkholderia sp.]
MFAISGVTGQVGGAAARALLAAGHPVRAIVRDESKAAPWRALGAEIAVASVQDTEALTAAFAGTEGVFAMIPPDFAPSREFPGARIAASSIVRALMAAKPSKMVALSSIGGHRESGLGLITQVRLFEDALAHAAMPTAILRPAWFMENSVWDIAPAQETGIMSSFLQPLDQPFPMIATDDIGKVIAQTLTQTWQGRRVIEIDGPQRYTQHEIAALLGGVLGRKVTAQPVPRDQWEAIFRAQGTDWPTPRIEMIDGFNRGWIEFEAFGVNERVTGTTRYETVLAQLAERVAVSAA